MFIILVVLTLSISAGLLARISTHRTQRTVFWSGLALVLLGLFLSLFGPAYANVVGVTENDYLKNGFLIISSVGANLIAASVLLDK